MKKYFLFIGLLLMAVVSGCCHGGAGKAGYRKVEIARLAAEPARMLGHRLEVSGQLQNLGTNYFADLNLVLMDKEGRSIAVSAWLPLSVPPPRPGSDPRNRPALISDLLGKEVRLQGVWEKQTTEGGEKYTFRVEKHEIIIEGGR